MVEQNGSKCLASGSQNGPRSEAKPEPLPSSPSPSPSPATTPNSSTARTNGFADAREEAARSNETEPIDDNCWVVGYRRDRISATVLLLGFKPPVTELMRTRRWAVKIPGEGWSIPNRYLAHVEKLLAGADTAVELFDIDGAPTPGQRDRERAEERTQTNAVVAEIEAARKTSQTNQEATDRARLEARRSFDAAVAAARASRGETEPETATETVGAS